jgi:hypothetical protein
MIPKKHARAQAGVDTGFRKRSCSANKLKRFSELQTPQAAPELSLGISHVAAELTRTRQAFVGAARFHFDGVAACAMRANGRAASFSRC